jgi:predicted NBD/HSP70 family sugar kinase
MASNHRLLAPQRAKEMRVLALVEARGMATRRALAEETGMHAASLNRLVAGLVERGILRAVEADATRTRGRPSDRLALHPGAGAVIGLEFGRGHLTGVVLDATGAVVHVAEGLEAPPFAGEPATFDDLVAAGWRLAQRSGVPLDRVRAAGVALHDVVTADGAWLTQERLHEPAVDARGELERRLGRRVVVDDVSRAFALAEHRYGAGAGQPDMIYVFIGSHGVGGGFFVNDRMLASSSGICGELGHVVVDEAGERCQCGSVGCLETVASHRAIERRLESLRDTGVTTRVPPGARFDAICRAAGAGDKAANLVLADLADALGCALGAAVNLLGAPAVVIGGSLRQAGEPFVTRVAGALRPRVVSGLTDRVVVRYATLAPWAGAWGAATLAREVALHEGAFLDDVPLALAAS